VQDAVFKADNAHEGSLFGEALALAADGRTLVVGAPGEKSNQRGVSAEGSADRSVRESGAVYVFVERDDVWHQQAYVKADNTDVEPAVASEDGEPDAFGADVALSADGNVLAVGARGEDSAQTMPSAEGSMDGGLMDAGAVYVFERTDGMWQQRVYLKADNAGSKDFFGSSVSLSGAGDVLMVGAPHESSAQRDPSRGGGADDGAEASGAAYVFEREAEAWVQRLYLKADNADDNDRFGTCVTIMPAGNALAVGAIGEASGFGELSVMGSPNDRVRNAGAAYLYIFDSE